MIMFPQWQSVCEQFQSTADVFRSVRHGVVGRWASSLLRAHENLVLNALTTHWLSFAVFIKVILVMTGSPAEKLVRISSLEKLGNSWRGSPSVGLRGWMRLCHTDWKPQKREGLVGGGGVKRGQGKEQSLQMNFEWNKTWLWMLFCYVCKCCAI